MPFTFSHPAAIIPFSYLPKRWVSITGLIAGSVAPDFEYFIRMELLSKHSHTFKGMFYFDLPIALILTFAFHYLVRNSLINNAPENLRLKYSSFINYNWYRQFIHNPSVILFSIIIGVSTHIIWDAFTHHSGYFVQNLPWLQLEFNIFEVTLSLPRIIQHASTIIGGIIVLRHINLFPFKFHLLTTLNQKFWLTTFLLSLVLAQLYWLSMIQEKINSNIIAAYISLFMIALIINSIIDKKLKLYT